MQKRRLNAKLLFGLLAGFAVVAVVVHFFHRYQMDKNADKLLNLAKQAEGQGDARQAAEYYKRYLNFRKHDYAGYVQLAKTLVEVYEAPEANREDLFYAYNAAEVAVRTIVPDGDPEHDKLHEDARRVAADFALSIGRVSDALHHLEYLTEKHPDDPELSVKYAKALIGSRAYPAAIELLQSIVGYDVQADKFDASSALAANQIEPYVMLAGLERQVHQNRSLARRTLDQMVQANPDSFEAFLERGRFLRRIGEKEAAKEDIARARELAPDDADVLILAADVARDDDATAARRLLETGLEKHPKDSRFYRVLAEMALQENHTSAALDLVNRGLDAISGNRYLLLMKANIQLQDRDIDAVHKTMAEMEKAKLPPELLEFLRARIKNKEGDWTVCARMLEKVRPAMAAWGTRQIVQIDLLLGECYERMGQNDRAVDAYERASLSNPDNQLARAGFQRTQRAVRGPRPTQPRQDALPAETGSTLSIDEQLAAILKERPNVKPFVKEIVRAELYAREESYDEARKILEEVRQAHPDEPHVWVSTARFALRDPEGGIQKALALLDEAQKRFGKDRPLALTRAGLWGLALDQATRAEDASPEKLAALIEDARKDIGDTLVTRLAEVNLAVMRKDEHLREKLAQVEKGVDQWKKEEQATFWDALWRTYYRAGLIEDSERCLQQVAHLLPNNLKAKTALFRYALEANNDQRMRAIVADVRALKEETVWRYLEASRLVALVREGHQDASGLADAERLLEEAKQTRPDWHELYRVQGQIDVLRNDYEAAAASLYQSLELGPANPVVVRNLYQILSRLGRSDEAQQVLARLTPEQQTEVSPQQQAQNLLAVGKTDEALAAAQRVVDEDATNPLRHLWHAQILRRAGRADEAEQALRKAIELKPDSAQSWLGLIQQLAAAGKKVEAEQEIRRASMALAEDELPLLRAKSYEALGDLAQAEENYLMVYRARPDDSAVLRTVASFYIGRLGNQGVSRAVPFLQRMLAAGDEAAAEPNRNVMWARRMMARIMAVTGNYQQTREAIALVQKNAVDGALPTVDKRELATVLSARPEPEFRRQAIDLFEELEGEGKLLPDQSVRLAALYWATNDWRKCRTMMNDIVAQPKIDVSSPIRFCRMLIDHGDLEEAARLMKLVRKSSPPEAAVRDLQTRLLAKQGKAQEAAKTLAKGLPSPLAAKDVPALNKIATLLSQLQLYEQAEKVFRKAAELEPARGRLILAHYLGLHGDLGETFQILKEQAKTQKILTVLRPAVAAVRNRPREETQPFDKVIEGWFEKAQRENPGAASIAVELAMFREVQERYDDMEAVYRGLTQRDDLPPAQRAVALNNLAFQLALREKDLDEALQMIGKAIEIVGPTASLLDTRAMVKSALGDHDGALADIRLTLSANPTAIQLFNLACIQLATGESQSARDSLTRAQAAGLTGRSMNSQQRSRYEKMMQQLDMKKA